MAREPSGALPNESLHLTPRKLDYLGFAAHSFTSLLKTAGDQREVIYPLAMNHNGAEIILFFSYFIISSFYVHKCAIYRLWLNHSNSH
jgi:hypothetical protein